MKNIGLLTLALLLPRLAHAESGKTCAALNDCRVKQSSVQQKKRASYIRHLHVDAFCDADVHSLPLEGGMELELSLKGKQAQAKLTKGGVTLASRLVALEAEKLTLTYRAKDAGGLSAEVTCTKK